MCVELQLSAGLGEEVGGACYRRYERHQHTCQCKRVDAWPMLVADTGKRRLESTKAIPGISVGEHANDPLAWSGLHVHTHTDGGNHCKTMYQLSFTPMCFATCIAPFGGIGFPWGRISATALQLCNNHWVFGHVCIKTMLSKFFRSLPSRSQGPQNAEQPGENTRVTQLSPPGSSLTACDLFGEGCIVPVIGTSRIVNSLREWKGQPNPNFPFTAKTVVLKSLKSRNSESESRSSSREARTRVPFFL